MLNRQGNDDFVRHWYSKKTIFFFNLDFRQEQMEFLNPISQAKPTNILSTAGIDKAESEVLCPKPEVLIQKSESKIGAY